MANPGQIPVLVWDFSGDPSGKSAVCVICKDGTQRTSDYLRRRHEQTDSHKALLEHLHATPPAPPPDVASESPYVTDGLRNLLASLAGRDVRPYPDAAYQNPASPPGVGINWNLMEANAEGELSMSADEQAVAFIAGNILERFDLPVSDDELEEHSEDDSQSEEEPEVIDAPLSAEFGNNTPFNPPPQKRARMQDETANNRYWFPWPDRISCTLDILMHLPRSVFSQKQLDLFLWLLKVNEVDDVPSIKQMQKINLALQKVCGIETIAYDGALGHKYFVNSLAQIIAQEMANPRVRPHLHFYPEDSGQKLSEARQGQRWLNEIPDEQTTPMVRISGNDYYIYEPAMLDSGSAECCIPIRWFSRGGQFFAKCWQMAPVSTDTHSGWHVCDPRTKLARPWDYTDPVKGNHWRAKASGSRVVVFPMWVYCDDTSGNVSKKWNEHNSFLMTPAGLPRSEAQKEYNIHFLCTSNIAQPLEMLDGIVEQLEEAQGNGIWAWDIELNEPVLVIPEVLALLGDNPMQSEFACHIGLRGKLFCRACWVKGHDAMDADDGDDAPPRQRSRAPSDAGSVHSDGASVAGSDVPSDVEGSDAGSEKLGGNKKGAKRFKESMGEMVERVKSFMKVGRLRRKPETTEKLRSFFTEASTKLDTKTKVKKLRTENGLKDTFQLVFIEKLFASYHKKRGAQNKQAALDAALANLPKETTSPVWRIRGLDPHQDTPVEILHVILLGFIKYLWRDLIAQLKGKDEKKELLITRLNSLDVTGLGISPLAGKTLVQYSGSLTGRDFRAIAQVAPFVLYDLVSAECFETWQALSKLVPLIWQPEIEDIEQYLALLTKEIDNFLACAAKWTTRWFNKPKFHILLHLPAHIRRFGPAILFATEAFESFNAVIRAKSVHSNRHAPSRDIAHAFAQGNRIRHLLSGGLFVLNSTTATAASENEETSAPTKYTFTRDASAWRQVGDGPKRLVAGRSTITHYLGLDGKKKTTPGLCVAGKSPPRPVVETLTGTHIPSWSSKPGRFKTNKIVYAVNGDPCEPQDFVIAREPDGHGKTFVGRMEEIIQKVGSTADHSSEPDGVLLRRAVVDGVRARYGMPSVILREEWTLHSAQDVLCAVNVQHNCMDHRCTVASTVPIFQERARTTQTAARVVHSHPQDDVVLNTAQMRDAVLVQPYRVHSTALDVDRVVTESAAKEVDARRKRATAAASATIAAPRASVRSRSNTAAAAPQLPSPIPHPHRAHATQPRAGPSSSFSVSPLSPFAPPSIPPTSLPSNHRQQTAFNPTQPADPWPANPPFISRSSHAYAPPVSRAPPSPAAFHQPQPSHLWQTNPPFVSHHPHAHAPPVSQPSSSPASYHPQPQLTYAWHTTPPFFASQPWHAHTPVSLPAHPPNTSTQAQTFQQYFNSETDESHPGYSG
ncbi:hypothetical protein R3P38DRAFT_3313080 [Favolaschia claudopus]|uniref:Transposase n=1 Tax=Favolaschia claudopus TaxID=2862362 RepID=A0AAW0C430_9AGAR